MAIVFYYSPMSSAVRIHWVLEELGLPYEKVKLDLQAGDQKKPEFLKLNPNGKVPTLVDDGVPIFESVAQIIYLGDKYGVDKKLWPAMGTPARMHALSWTVWSTATLGAAVFRFALNSGTYLAPELRSAAQAEHARKEISEHLRVLDQHLDGRLFVVGDSFSLADLANASLLGWGIRNGIDLSPFPRVSAWVATCTARPALARVLAG